MSNEDKTISLVIPFGTIFKVIFVFLLAYFVYLVRDLVLVIVASVVIASAIEPITRWFQSKRVPRVLGVLIVYLVAILMFTGLVYSFLPELIKDVRDVIDRLPSYVQSLNSVDGIRDNSTLSNVINQTLSSSGIDQIVNQLGNMSDATFGFFSVASTIFGGVLSLLLIIVLSFYLAVQEDGVADFIKIVIPIKHEKYALDLWKRAQEKIGFWMQGQLILSVIVAVILYLGLSILSVPNALLLALVGGLFELIPVFGPILSSIPAIAFGLVDGGLTKGLLVMGLYIIVQQFENHLLYPLVVKKIVGIPAIVVIVSLIVGLQIAGFIGAIISVPVAAAVMEILNDIEKSKIRENDSK